MDDGSTDGTPEMMRKEFPKVTFQRFERSEHSIVRRNQGARLVGGDIFFPIDDDAEFSTPFVVAQTLRQFCHPRIGAVAIPYTDVTLGPRVLHQAPDQEGIWVAGQFVGAAVALRRNVFLALGGYRELLLHMGEERDYSVRMLDAGYVVRLGTSDLIHHYASPTRQTKWNRRYTRRNDLVSAICNVPFPQLLAHVPGTILSGAFSGARNCCLWETLEGYFLFLTIYRKAWSERQPVAAGTYKALRLLKRCSCCRYETIEPLLSPLRFRDPAAPGP